MEMLPLLLPVPRLESVSHPLTCPILLQQLQASCVLNITMTGSDLKVSITSLIAHLTLLGLTHALQDLLCGTYLPFAVCMFLFLLTF
jgi:hypothetical protein